jgi:hypothetical protein
MSARSKRAVILFFGWRCVVQLKGTYGTISDSTITKLQILELFLPSPVFHD